MTFAEWVQTLSGASVHVLHAIDLILRVIVPMHVVLTKRQTRAAIGWVGLVWLSPVAASALYLMFGINRVQRRAAQLRSSIRSQVDVHLSEHDVATLDQTLGPDAPRFASLARLVAEVSDKPLRAGNQIDPLIDGDTAYASMLEAIRGATRSIALSTYIFHDDSIGREFTAALGDAVARGVAVRVLIDGLGSRYGFRSNVRKLRRLRVPVATFLPTLAPAWLPWIPLLNLRNHRKILVVDARLAFTGGMNIDARFLKHSPETRRQSRAEDARGGSLGHNHKDLHFRVVGPVVQDLLRVFLFDWAFTTREKLSGPDWEWVPDESPQGPTAARCVEDGPEDDVDPLLKSFMGAMAVASESIIITTPYFLPDEPFLSALEIAVLRGVRVEIYVPARSNLWLVQWAMPPFLERALKGGCSVALVPPPFDHTKLMVVDGLWVFLGTANIDSRSLRLNFEVNLECYGRNLPEALQRQLDEKRAISTPITLEQLRSLPLAIRVRNGFFRLLEPYL